MCLGLVPVIYVEKGRVGVVEPRCDLGGPGEHVVPGN